MIQNKFWKNKKVLITGIDGFVGSNLAKKLIRLEAKVYGIVQKKKNSLLYFESIHKKCKLFKGEITNKTFIDKLVGKNNFEIVFHLAAQVEVGVANKGPYKTWESNIRGTYTLLDSFTKCKKIKSIIVASSDKSYGAYPKKDLPYKEYYPSNAIYPYDVSKACADMIAKTYSSNLYNLPIVITRFANIYGPGQLHFSALIPDLARSIIKKTQFIPRGDGKDIRDYVFINDIVDLYLLLSLKLYKNKKLSGEVFNAGTNQPLTIKQIVKKFYNFKNRTKDLNKILRRMKNKKTKGEIKYQFMDFSKLYRYFKWKPEFSFDDTIEEVLNWYSEYLKKR